LAAELTTVTSKAVRIIPIPFLIFINKKTRKKRRKRNHSPSWVAYRKNTFRKFDLLSLKKIMKSGFSIWKSSTEPTTKNKRQGRRKNKLALKNLVINGKCLVMILRIVW
ncbi:MAG: hypothetical protein AAF573_21375, partial [Bacteroidota bacterium]